MNTNLIYVLFDPRNDIPVYVGKTTIGVNRPIKHIYFSHNIKVRDWVLELKKIGYSPIIKVIEKDIELEKLSDREKYWINEYSGINQSIFNIQLIPDIKSYKLNYDELILMRNLLNNIPSFIKNLRYITNMTQSEIGDASNSSLGTIKRAEIGKNISIDVLKDLIEIGIKSLNGELPEKSKSHVRLNYKIK